MADLARRRSQTNVSAGARMAKVVFFPSKWWSRIWAASSPAVLIGLGVLLGLQLCFALGNPTDLQSVEPSPDDVSAAARYFDEGRAAFKQDRFVEAAEAFEKADALAPNAKVLLLAIQSRELGGHASRAVTLAALATQRHPKDEPPIRGAQPHGRPRREPARLRDRLGHGPAEQFLDCGARAAGCTSCQGSRPRRGRIGVHTGETP